MAIKFAFLNPKYYFYKTSFAFNKQFRENC